ncbi:unnamed protein product [Cylindrotheca closterium]|uniref:Uncharacterized protein n=1 Tax=Cylindrotheca closterium TaxID=2856 RepID=A0AAD2G9G2_9STRA|nr:unnamed protein product [Cylindrotheca closterium]
MMPTGRGFAGLASLGIFAVLYILRLTLDGPLVSSTNNAIHTGASATSTANKNRGSNGHDEYAYWYYKEASVQAFTELAQQMSDFENLNEVLLGLADTFLSDILLKHMLHASNQMPPVGGFPPRGKLNCKDTKYASVLSGAKDKNAPKRIIDIIGFGFDPDILEVRLLEYYDLVDHFVIFEQDKAHRGFHKGFWLESLLRTKRFERFMDKITYIPYTVPNNLIPKNRAPQKFDWSLEGIMREIPIQHLKNTTFADMADEAKDNFYILQNDGDEIMSRKALAHFQQCELLTTIKYPIYAPAPTWKRNSAWMFHTYDMKGLPIGGEDLQYGELRDYLWRLGPTLWRWKDVEAEGSTIRGKSNQGSTHLGLGAANHFSSPGHAILEFIKGFTTVDSRFAGKSVEFWKRARDGQLNYDVDLNGFLLNFCDQAKQNKYSSRFPTIHVHAAVDKRTQDFVVQSLPWALTSLKPYRYPYLYHPNLADEEAQMVQNMCGFSVQEQAKK